MKKKGLGVVVCAISAAIMMAGCGSSGTGSASTEAGSSAAGSSAEATAAATADGTTQSEASYSAESPLTLQIGNGVDDENPQTIALNKFGKALEEATGGRIKYELFSNSSIGSDEEMVEMVRTNTLQMTEANITLKDYVPEMYAFGLPYLFHNYEDAYNYLTNADKAKEMWSKLETDTNLKKMAIYLNGSRALTTKGKSVKSPADLKGVKIRSMTSKVSQDTIEALGGTPVPMAYSELYVAMQTGVVDGQDNGISNVYSSKFYEVQDHFYKTEHGYTINCVYINSDFYNSLTDEDQAAFDQLAKQYLEDEYSKDMDEYYKTAEAALVENGMTIVEQSEMDMQAFYDSADEMIEKNYMSDPTYADVVNDVKAFCGYE